MSTKKEIIPQVLHDNVPKVLLPEKLSFRDAARFCAAKADEEEAVTIFPFEIVGVFPWTGAFAVNRLLEREFSATLKSGFDMTIDGAKGRTSFKWGIWEIHGLGTLSMEGTKTAQGVNVYRLLCHSRRMLADKVAAFFEKVLAEVHKRELYAGCALLLQPDSDGDLNIDSPPMVLPIPAIDSDALILNRETELAVNAECFHAIRQGMRRGIMLAGRPGTGKTLSARIASRIALDQGWSVFYLPDARALESALAIAAAHAPALLVCEDIDRQLSGARTALTDRILNALDGLDRSAKVVLIATSNDPSRLPAALLRPGRLDSSIPFDAPNAETASRLLQLYMPSTAKDIDYAQAGQACARLLAASIAEVVTRASLYASFDKRSTLTTKDILNAAASVTIQQRMLERAELPQAKDIPAIRLLMEDPEAKALQEMNAPHKGNGHSTLSLAELGSTLFPEQEL